MNRPTLYLFLASLLVAAPVVATAGATQVAGEASRTSSQADPRWKLTQFPATSTTSLGYREMRLERLVELERRNAGRHIKATQIGVGRTLASEGIARSTPALRWIPLKAGGSVARLRVASPDALGMRVGIQTKGLHPHVELRFGGSDDPGHVVAETTAAEARALADADGVYWTPATDGAAQIIEIYRPAHVTMAQARVQAPQASHLLANSRNDFKIVEKVGESGTCNINAVCRVGQLGPAYVQAKDAVAHMVFVDGGSSYICTGTLLNDTTPATQVPYFYSAAHCIETQTVANTLNTYWGYENSGCSTADGQRRNPLTGGADILFVDADVDALLLRLKNPAPANATFAGWDAGTLAPNAEVVAIHHPAGDAKKYSRGQHVTDVYPENYTVGWLEGTTEGGSSGSGLFTLHADKTYRLRGGLYGGNASCANTGNVSTAANRDHYSRLDLIFPQIKQWIAADPVRENGSQALVRSAGAVAQGQGARTLPVTSTPAPATVTPPTARDRLPILQRRTGTHES